MKRLLLIAALAVFGCDKSSSHKSPALSASPPPTEALASAKPPAPSASAPTTPPADVAKGPAPAGSSASAPDRQAAVYDLLAGGPALEQLPLVAAEQGAEFDVNPLNKVAPAVAPVRVRESRVDVKGSLPKEVVRRIVRRQIPQLRSCYTRNTDGQARPRGQAGRPVRDRQNRNGGDGQEARRHRSRGRHTCSLRALRALRFPKPESGGVVLVDYSFELGSTP